MKTEDQQHLAIYDRRDLGMLIERNGRCDAFDRFGVLLGRFSNARAALNAGVQSPFCVQTDRTCDEGHR